MRNGHFWDPTLLFLDLLQDNLLFFQQNGKASYHQIETLFLQPVEDVNGTGLIPVSDEPSSLQQAKEIKSQSDEIRHLSTLLEKQQAILDLIGVSTVPVIFWHFVLSLHGPHTYRVHAPCETHLNFGNFCQYSTHTLYNTIYTVILLALINKLKLSA